MGLDPVRLRAVAPADQTCASRARATCAPAAAWQHRPQPNARWLVELVTAKGCRRTSERRWGEPATCRDGAGARGAVPYPWGVPRGDRGRLRETECIWCRAAGSRDPQTWASLWWTGDLGRRRHGSVRPLESIPGISGVDWNRFQGTLGRRFTSLGRPLFQGWGHQTGTGTAFGLSSARGTSSSRGGAFRGRRRVLRELRRCRKRGAWLLRRTAVARRDRRPGG